MVNKLPTTVDTFNGLNNVLDAKAALTIASNVLNQKQVDARKALTEARNRIINEYNDTTKHPDGQKALGVNEAAREAALDVLTLNERKEVDSLTMQINKVNGEIALACLECDRWRYTLRLLETDALSNSSSIKYNFAGNAA